MARQSKVVCAACGKRIKGEAIWHVPPNYMIALGVDSEGTYHPDCYKEAHPEVAITRES